MIVMLSDSVVTITRFPEEGDSITEYQTDSKYLVFQGVGCITAWGDRDYNRLGQYLRKRNILPNTHSVEDLVKLTHEYLCNEYLKNDDVELGFHIGGFDKTGKPCLHHVFWGLNRPRRSEELKPSVQIYDHSDLAFLYNGHNELADAVITTLTEQIKNNQDVRFDLTKSKDRIDLCELIARFASENTPEVGPPFVLNLISPNNSIKKIENTSYSPTMGQSLASPTTNFPQSNEYDVLGILLTKSSEDSPTGTFTSKFSLQQTQGGTITYILPKNQVDR